MKKVVSRALPLIFVLFIFTFSTTAAFASYRTITVNYSAGPPILSSQSVITKSVPSAYKTVTIKVPKAGPGNPGYYTQTKRIPTKMTYTIHTHEWVNKKYWYGNHFITQIVCKQCGAAGGPPLDFEIPGR